MKNILLFLIIFASLPVFSCSNFKYPSTMTLEEDFLSIGTDFTLYGGDKILGSVEERVMNFSTTFEFLDLKGKLIARGKKELVSFGSKIDLFDCRGKLLGTIEEEVIESFFSYYTKYAVKDTAGRVLAFSEKTKPLATSFELFSSKTKFAYISRPTFRIKDSWEISLKNRNLDPVFVIMVGAFKTASDKAKNRQNE